MTILGLFLNEELRTGGHRRYLELLEGLAARGNRVVAILSDRLAYEPERFEARRISAPYVRNGFSPIALRFRGAIRRALPDIRRESHDVDCVLVHGETHLLAAVELKRALGVSLVFGHRSNAVREGMVMLEEGRSSLKARLTARWEIAKYRRYEQLVAREAALVVFQSTFDRDDFRSRTPLRPERTAVVGGNIGGPRFPRECAGTNRSDILRRVIFVGTYGPRKGVRYLVDAIVLLAHKGLSELRFEIVGPGEKRLDYEARLRAEGLGGMVEFRGRIDDPLSAIAAADLMVVPSLFDSFPDTVLEALHVGTPVIGSRVGGIPDQLVHDELLFSPMDAEAIAARIERCVREPEFYRRLRDLCSARRAAFTFDWVKAWGKAIAELS